MRTINTKIYLASWELPTKEKVYLHIYVCIYVNRFTCYRNPQMDVHADTHITNWYMFYICEI